MALGVLSAVDADYARHDTAECHLVHIDGNRFQSPTLIIALGLLVDDPGVSKTRGSSAGSLRHSRSPPRGWPQNGARHSLCHGDEYQRLPAGPDV